MNYSLGNMLSRGGALNPDGLSLDLQFAADKTLTARKGPTPTFTRASTATFVGSDGLIQSAAINTPRFDHDPVTLACKGLLIEESKTNLATYSEDFSLGFAIERASIDPNITTAPNGSTTADKLIEDTTPSNNHRLTRIVNLSAIPYTFSVFAKASERSWIRLTLFDNVTARQVWFNVSAGVIGTQSGAIGQIQSFGNGWWRCSITATGLAFISSQANIALATADNISAYTGDGTSGLFLWGAQLEAGSFPTSYMPTAAATVFRSADVCSITGSDFTGFYNQSEGTMLLKATSLMATATLGNRTFISFTDGSYPNQQGLYKATNTNNLSFPIGAGTGNAIAAITIGSSFTVSGAFAASNCAASFNGAAAVTVAGSPSTVVTKLEFRDPTGAPGGHPTMHISQFRYYKKRLPNAKLQSLTL